MTMSAATSRALWNPSTKASGDVTPFASAAMIVAASRKKTIVTAQDVQDARVDRGRA